MHLVDCLGESRVKENFKHGSERGHWKRSLWQPRQCPTLPQCVVPTHVGVDRRHSTDPPPAGSRPHARGGGPAPKQTASILTQSSPRTWGWTVQRQPCHRSGNVVPTHVGGDRSATRPRPASRRRPHARGGGPEQRADAARWARSSPRTWGWTARCNPPLDESEVVPTHVGVDRRRIPPIRPNTRRPHARGGGP